MTSSAKVPDQVTPAKAAKAANVYDTGDAAKNDILKQKQSFLGSMMAGEDETKEKGVGFLG